ncbi:MAG TPA: ABC transporter substrate-binding protein [Dongiaceae bacterium]|nr:ABC transporter substrate-binding protein [Dongiaceae bacterium]
MHKTLLAMVGLPMLLAAGGAFADEQVEVLHWWTSGGEAKALTVLKDNLQKEGVGWMDMPVAGGGGDAAMTVLRTRVTSGNPPTAAQMLGFDITSWAEQGALGDLTPIAEKEGWDKVIPAALQKFSKYDGKWIAAPVNVHSTNWVWINKALYDKAGDPNPTDYDGFVAMLDKFKAEGATPLAIGGDAMQEMTLLDSVTLTTGGIDFYKKAFVDLDQSALGSDTMKKIFERMVQLAGYADSNIQGRTWDQATAMVIKGDAGVQVMGDWAKGEFRSANKKPGTDFVCLRFPGTQGDVTFNSDQFAMFKVGADRQDAQYKLAAAVEDPAFQSAFNVVKGSVPARTDVPDTAFDDCGKKGMKDLAEANEKGTLVGSLAHGHAAPPAVKQAVSDVVVKLFSKQITPDEAVKELPEAVAAAQ